MIWEKAFGALRESRFSGRPSGQKRSYKHSLKDDSNLNNDCGMQSLRFQTFSALGSSGPRCNHLLRTVPPSQSAAYAAGHDAGMQQTMVALLGTLPGDHEQTTMAHNLASLPMRLGGLGLRSARRLAHTGLRGAMQCPRCRSGCLRQPQSSRASWQGFHEVVWENCTPRAGFWTVKVSWAGQRGRSCWQVRFLYHLKPQTLANGSIAGRTTHLPHMNTISGRTLYLPSHMPAIRPTCDPTQDPQLGQCTELRLGSNTRCSLSSSAPWFWNVCVCLSSSPMRRASAVARMTCWAGTEPRVRGLASPKLRCWVLGSPSATGHSWPLTSPSEAR